jgi:beta-lactamase superfamily II metal-dependent hydrolase
MYEVDFLPVGDGKNSGDAIAMRFTRPDTGAWAHVIIDAGFQDDGPALVEHVKHNYGTNTIDVAVLTHPDGDHIGGMGAVVRGLDVRELWLHDIGAHGGGGLPAAAAVKELIGVAQARGTDVYEVWAGHQALGGALTVLGPDRAYYEQLVAEQLEPSGPPAAAKALIEAARGLLDRIVDALPVEVPFAEKEVSPRNNTSVVTLLTVDEKRLLFTADAGVPALERAWTFAEARGLSGPLSMVQVPHHGSRRNASSAWLDRLLGPTGQSPTRLAMLSVVSESDKHPSGRVVNAYIRRGCDILATAGNTKYHFFGLPLREGWSPATPLAPMVEEDD